MQFSNLFADDDAVSPVIGVILMVAITVILAAVIGTFVLGLGDQVSNTSPQASFSFDFTEESASGGLIGTESGSDGTLEITHDGGDGIVGNRLSVNDDDGDGPIEDPWSTGATKVTAGQTTSVSANTDDTVRVIWSSANGGDSATLGTWTGPDA